MITNLKDNHGKIIAYCEWRLVGQSGYEVPNGEYVWINDAWVHPEFRHLGKIERIIDEVMRSAPSAQYGYFQRKDHNEKLRIFTKQQFERRRMTHDKFMEIK